MLRMLVGYWLFAEEKSTNREALEALACHLESGDYAAVPPNLKALALGELCDRALCVLSNTKNKVDHPKSAGDELGEIEERRRTEERLQKKAVR